VPRKGSHGDGGWNQPRLPNGGTGANPLSVWEIMSPTLRIKRVASSSGAKRKKIAFVKGWDVGGEHEISGRFWIEAGNTSLRFQPPALKHNPKKNLAMRKPQVLGEKPGLEVPQDIPVGGDILPGFRIRKELWEGGETGNGGFRQGKQPRMFPALASRKKAFFHGAFPCPERAGG